MLTTQNIPLFFFIVAAGCLALYVTLSEWDPQPMLMRQTRRAKRLGAFARLRAIILLEGQKIEAYQYGVRFDVWVGCRFGLTAAGVLLGISTGIPILIVVAPLLAWIGFPFAVAGRAQSQRFRQEREFITELRNLRDRMSISNQSLDTALHEMGRRPAKGMENLLSPLARGGSITENIAEVGNRSRSPIIEYACAVLIWARSRSLEGLIDAIDDVLLPIGEAQLMVQEEAQVTLTQQRAVTFAMAGLMSFMFFVVLRVETFVNYYRTVAGQVTLGIVVAMFLGLVWLLNVIVKVETWTRWDLGQLIKEQDRLNA